MNEDNNKVVGETTIKYFSMYSGVGGFEYGIQQAINTLGDARKPEDLQNDFTNNNDTEWGRASATCDGNNNEESNRPDIRNRNEDLSKDSTDTKKSPIRSVCVGYSEIDKYAEAIQSVKPKDERLQTKEDSGSINSDLLQRTTCVGYSEIDKYAEAVYKYNYGTDIRNYGNADDIIAEELPDFDLLVGGFPCQAFSIAGKRRGFDDTRGTQFFNVARIVREKQPRLLVLENVKGLLSHDKGRTFHTIIATLDELGYDVEWQVLNSKLHGVPQNRERVFIIGRLRGTGGRQVFPFTGENRQDTRRIGQELSVCLDANYVKGATVNTLRKQHVQTNRGEGSKQDKEEPKHYIIIDDYNSNIRTDGNTPTITQNVGLKTVRNGVKVKEKMTRNIRRLTPVECERLQGFPDDWTKYGIIDGEVKEMSDTQRYKMMGNAVTTNVVRDIMIEVMNDE